MKPHKHAALIHAWADGATIQYQDSKDRRWWDIETPDTPMWDPVMSYRVKPEPIHQYINVYHVAPTTPEGTATVNCLATGNRVRTTADDNGTVRIVTPDSRIHLTFDPDTFDLINATMEKP